MTVPTGLSVSGSPITTSGTLAVTYASGYAIPTTTKQTEWDTAYTDRLKWDGGATGLNAATARASLDLEIGTDVQAYDADLAALAGLSTNGMIARTGAGTAAVRSIAAGTGITVTNGDGVSGNPTVALTSNTISGVALGNNLNTLTLGTGLGGTSYNALAPSRLALPMARPHPRPVSATTPA